MNKTLMHILVVDDEPMARQRLCRILLDILPQASISEAANGLAALQEARTKAADIVLLDIRMPGMDGIETASHLNKLHAPPAVIFTTAYDKHALQAFAVNAIDYLLKPVQADQLDSAIAKARVLSQAQLKTIQQQPQNYISGNSDRSHELLLLPAEDVCYMQADNRYISVVSARHRIIATGSLVDMEHRFGGQFIRVHRNTLAGIAHIKSLQRHSSGSWVLHFHGITDSVTISRRMLTNLRRKLQI